MRDVADNCVVVCSIENFDPMGVHTGDSITVAPAQTLSDVEYQAMRDDAFAVLRRVGVETGGSNVQFAVDPATGERLVIEMNPRVSRSSALASKATGFPIAKIATRLAVGYRLDEIANDITGATPACFEPVIDYVVTKVPRWQFEKLPGAEPRLGTRMQSVGEVMAIGRTFTESCKRRCAPSSRAPRAERRPRRGAPRGGCDRRAARARPHRRPPTASSSSRPLLRRGVHVEQLAAATGIDPWFLDQLGAIVAQRDQLARSQSADRRAAGADGLRAAKRLGLLRRPARPPARLDAPRRVRAARLGAGVRATFKTVDTCARGVRGRTRRTTTRPTRRRTRSRPRRATASSSSARARTASARGSSSTTAACTPRARCATRATRRSWSTATPRPCRRTTTPSDRLYFEPLTEEDVPTCSTPSAARAPTAGSSG